MKAWELIDSCDVPDDDGVMYLHRRGGEYVIHVDGAELMTNQDHGSEDALADLACDLLADLGHARVLVGGLGMGFTMAAALRRVGRQGVVTVAELMPAVVRWNRDYVGEAARHPLRDRRSRVHVGSVSELLGPQAQWDAILLDVDNGPRDLSRAQNSSLYDYEGLLAAGEALAPGGVLGIWSATPDDTLTDRLEQLGFQVAVHEHFQPGRPHSDYNSHHVLWMATSGVARAKAKAS